MVNTRLITAGPTDAPWNAVSAFANCGRAVAHVRGSYVRQKLSIVHQSRRLLSTMTARTLGSRRCRAIRAGGECFHPRYRALASA